MQAKSIVIFIVARSILNQLMSIILNVMKFLRQIGADVEKSMGGKKRARKILHFQTREEISLGNHPEFLEVHFRTSVNKLPRY